jgi:hypothetical protein
VRASRQSRRRRHRAPHRDRPGQQLIKLPTLGGSAPLYLFPTALGIPTINHDNNQHGANENLRLQNRVGWDRGASGGDGKALAEEPLVVDVRVADED